MDESYKIIGGDGEEYGPVSLTELKKWITDGRLATVTQVWSSDSGRWGPALQYMELHPEIGQIADLTSVVEATSLDAVGFWPRLGAYLIDQIILNILSYLLLGPPKLNLPPIVSSTADLMAIWEQAAPRLGWETLLAMIYTVVLTGWIGASLGKLAIGARIVNTDGSRFGFGKALQRWLATILSNLTFGIGYLLIAFRTDRRALHDLLAGTQVVYRR